jgi:hypothetical protein
MEGYTWRRSVGAWRSLAAHLAGGQGVGGSNPLAPTIRASARMARFGVPEPVCGRGYDPGVEDQEARRKWVYERLIWSLRWLAADAEAALAAVRATPASEEMALLLEDILPAAQHYAVVEQSTLEAVSEIHRAFDPVARDWAFWTDDAVRSNELWQAQRERARAVLSTLNEERADDRLRGNVLTEL